MAERDRGWSKTDSDIDDQLYSPGVRDAKSMADDLRDKVREALRNNNKTHTGDPEIGILDLVTAAANRNGKGRAGTRVEDLVRKAREPTMSLLNDIFYQDKKRIDRYMSYDQIYELIPEMADAAETLASNVLSPEQFGTPALGVDAGLSDMASEADKREAAARIESLLENHDIHRNLFDQVQDAVIYGDLFLHVADLDAEIAELLPKESKDKKRWLSENGKNPAAEPVSESVWVDLSPNGKTGPWFGVEDGDRSNSPERFADEVRSLVQDAFVWDGGCSRAMKTVRRGLAEAGRSRMPAGSQGKRNKGREDLIAGRGNVIVRKLDPRRVVKLMAATHCVGYYHVDFADEVEFGARSYQSMRMSGNFQDFYGRQSSDHASTEMGRKRFDFFADTVVKELARKIDRPFLAANPEFKEVVASILRAKDFATKRVSVSFLEPRDVVHFHPGGRVYGKSMYFKSLFMAMLYLATIMSTTMRAIVKSAEEKIIWVETSGLDNKPENTVARVAQDLEGRNFSVDDFGDISQAMRLASAFKTMYIPMNDGQKPIEMDSIAGQDPQINSEFIEYLRNAMIAGTGVPQAFLGLKEDVEYARTLTMQNGNFGRKTIRWQQEIADGYTELIRKLYEATWPDDETLSTSSIVAKFTPPSSLNDRNVSESFEVGMGVVERMAEVLVGTEDEELVRKMKLELIKKRFPQLDWEEAEDTLQDLITQKDQDALRKGGDEGGDEGGGGF